MVSSNKYRPKSEKQRQREQRSEIKRYKEKQHQDYENRMSRYNTDRQSYKNSIHSIKNEEYLCPKNTILKKFELDKKYKMPLQDLRIQNEFLKKKNELLIDLKIRIQRRNRQRTKQQRFDEEESFIDSQSDSSQFSIQKQAYQRSSQSLYNVADLKKLKDLLDQQRFINNKINRYKKITQQCYQKKKNIEQEIDAYQQKLLRPEIKEKQNSISIDNQIKQIKQKLANIQRSRRQQKKNMKETKLQQQIKQIMRKRNRSYY